MPASAKLLEEFGLEPPSCGSLWRVAEYVWKKVIPDYNQDSDRKGHYGLALGERPHKIKKLRGAYGMFIGSSKKREESELCLEVRNLSPYKEKNYITYFQIIVRAVPQRYFIKDDSDIKISRKDFKRAVGRERYERVHRCNKSTCYRPLIISNSHKEMLNSKEQHDFEELLKQLGI